ncbi:hypothetical protein K1T71_013950 [Dendrolimus kikuchii]|uniref:Uncharacterized protein n=1 Tax=Dendrolimus kikuchii TaxID=765133 RepID=A0ACC1CG74_9NEOP|nr:hypothetical protein K1T71_013950 [Dendrolimus kikuchii]
MKIERHPCNSKINVRSSNMKVKAINPPNTPKAETETLQGISIDSLESIKLDRIRKYSEGDMNNGAPKSKLYLGSDDKENYVPNIKSHFAVADLKQPRQQKINELKYLNDLEEVGLEKLFSHSLYPMRFKRPDGDCTSTTTIPSSDEIPQDRRRFDTGNEDQRIRRLSIETPQAGYNKERRNGQSEHIGIPKVIPDLNAEMLAVCRNIIARVSLNHDYY